MVAREYRGLRPLVLYLSINRCCYCNDCICNASQQFMIVPFLHVCKSCRECSGVPYSCLLHSLIGGYWSLSTVYVHGSMLLLIDQSDQRMILSMCYIAVCKVHWLFVDCQVIPVCYDFLTCRMGAILVHYLCCVSHVSVYTRYQAQN